MPPLRISYEAYRDKVLGCWMGKNAGGTLGTPLEKMWGESEPFDIDYYPVLREGGIPNDDLEIQLVWLIMLEERGLDITCRDFAEYWLDYVVYNPDEYGLHKTNLRQGLIPPVSGWYNNAFRDCMGSPIRSEIWACIAPGMPDVAAHYAWHDAVVDHAMGESVYGEMFNAALQSAAFFIPERDRLLDLGLSVIPADCATARAVRKAREAHASGLEWREARDAVMGFAYHPNAQHSPINLAFQTLGWLYGTDFGDMLCKAVNCGWDTDCTGATLGATLGIIMGAEALPARWTEPLGRTLATSVGNGGLRNGPLPATVDELTDRTIAVARKLLAREDGRVQICDDAEAAAAPVNVKAGRIEEITRRRQDCTCHRTPALDVQVAYPEQPVIGTLKPVPLEVILTNRMREELAVACFIHLPPGFTSTVGDREDLWIAPSQSVTVHLSVSATDPGRIGVTNRGELRLIVHGRPAVESIPVVLMGARRWLVFPSSSQPLDEQALLSRISMSAPTEGWQVAEFAGNELVVEPYFAGRPGLLYLLHFVNNPEARTARLGVPTDGRMKLWLNGNPLHETREVVPLRPSLGGEESNYVDCDLPQGWSHVLIRLERGESPLQAHFTAAFGPPWWHGFHDLGQTRFPWD
jgi:ADP-ribosylglycohydrolase